MFIYNKSYKMIKIVLEFSAHFYRCLLKKVDS